MAMSIKSTFWARMDLNPHVGSFVKKSVSLDIKL